MLWKFFRAGIGSALAGLMLSLSVGAANATLVTFDISGDGTGTWTVDTTTGLVPNEGLHGSADITVTVAGYGLTLFETDDSTFFHHFGVLSTGGLPAIEIPSLSLASFVGFTGGTFSADACDGFLCSNVFQTDISLTFTSQAAGVPGPIAGAGLPGMVLACGGVFGWWRRRTKSDSAAVAAT